MGLIQSRALMLLDAKLNGVDFSSTLTLGRMKNNMHYKELKNLRKKYQIDSSYEYDNKMKYRSYADYFFTHYLGVKTLKVMDYSGYESADILHDLNYPIQQTLVENFDAVIDGGTLEHIFNFPTAINNCMMMVKNGGSIFIFSMANNHCGHGFYQFSPELFYRLFEERNGFIIKEVILVKHPFPGAELSKNQKCYTVNDPMIVGRRSTLVTRSPLGIMVHAKKIKSHNSILKMPLQSDYQSKWHDEQNSTKNPSWKSLSKVFLRCILFFCPQKFELWIRGNYMLRNSNLNRDSEFYAPYSYQ